MGHHPTTCALFSRSLYMVFGICAIQQKQKNGIRQRGQLIKLVAYDVPMVWTD